MAFRFPEKYCSHRIAHSFFSEKALMTPCVRPLFFATTLNELHCWCVRVCVFQCVSMCALFLSTSLCHLCMSLCPNSNGVGRTCSGQQQPTRCDRSSTCSGIPLASAWRRTFARQSGYPNTMQAWFATIANGKRFLSAGLF